MVGLSVSENWKRIQERVAVAQKRSLFSAQEVCIVGVTKLQPLEKIREGLECGIKHFGENYVQEFSKKNMEFHSEKINWHLIGPLQTNKAKQVVGYVDTIHTLDRESLAQVISRLAVEKKIKQKVLIQVNVAEEASKSGVLPNDILDFSHKVSQLEGLKISGLMTMPPFVENPEDSRIHFKKLREIREKLNSDIFSKDKLIVLSMGTSQDFEVAVEEGATHIRVGSILFGERE